MLDDDDEWITIDSGDGWRIGLQRADDHVPPRWPDQDRPQQAHLDFRAPDIDAAAERAQQLGAGLLRRNERWHTLVTRPAIRSTCASTRTIREPSL